MRQFNVKVLRYILSIGEGTAVVTYTFLIVLYSFQGIFSCIILFYANVTTVILSVLERI